MLLILPPGRDGSGRVTPSWLRVSLGADRDPEVSFALERPRHFCVARQLVAQRLSLVYACRRLVREAVGGKEARDAHFRPL